MRGVKDRRLIFLFGRGALPRCPSVAFAPAAPRLPAASAVPPLPVSSSRGVSAFSVSGGESVRSVASLCRVEGLGFRVEG